MTPDQPDAAKAASDDACCCFGAVLCPYCANKAAADPTPLDPVRLEAALQVWEEHPSSGHAGIIATIRAWEASAPKEVEWGHAFGAISLAVAAADGKGDNTPWQDVVQRIEDLRKERDALRAQTIAMHGDRRRAAAPAPVGEEVSRDERLWASAAFGIEEAAVTKYHVVHLVDQIDALWKLAKERLDSLAALRQPAGGGDRA
ncbi:MAG TPA: hypothetical protein VEZ12_13535 [Herpetosiphonaceae bacterium]|nr:hypothetical protein [Herpetosiphonaceae bacterium]